MKSLIALVLITALAVISLAQTAQNNTDEKLRARNAPDVFIYSASSFGPDKNRDSHLTIEVGNTGAKAIRVIAWEYCVPGDLAEGDRRVNGQFAANELKLAPGARIKLSGQVHHYSDSFVKQFRLDTVRILRVEYDDGSIWRRRVGDE